MFQTSINGITGQFEFDSDGYPITSQYDICITSTDESQQFIAVGTWNKSHNLHIADAVSFKRIFTDFGGRNIEVGALEVCSWNFITSVLLSLL